MSAHAICVPIFAEMQGGDFVGKNVKSAWKVWKRPHRKTMWKVSAGGSS